MDSETDQKIHELVAENARLKIALRPFADLAGTWTIQTAAQKAELLTISNGERMCGIPAQAFVDAAEALEA